MRISVDATEKKRKRGRPPVFEDLDALKAVYPELRSRRSLTEKAYLGRAIRVLGIRDLKTSPFPWLISEGTCRVSILAELGRVENDDNLRALAEAISANRLRARTARDRIRRFRLGRPCANGWLGLLQVLETTFNRYRDANPDLTWTDAQKAVEALLEGVREAAEDL